MRSISFKSIASAAFAVAVTISLGGANAAALSSSGGARPVFDPSEYDTVSTATSTKTKSTKTTSPVSAAIDEAAKSLSKVTESMPLSSSLPVDKLSKLSGEDHYSDTASWSFLSSSGKVVPGGKIVTKAGKMCSVGYIVEQAGVDHVLTAGHCGEVGTTFGYRNSAGTWTKLGNIVKSVNTADEDWALIKLETTKNVQSDLPVDNVSFSSRVMDADEAADADVICKLGQVSGLSCGKFSHVAPSGRVVFYGKATNGDSGGTVFAVKDGQLHPLGILEGGYNSSATLAVQPLDRIQNQTGASVQS